MGEGEGEEGAVRRGGGRVGMGEGLGMRLYSMSTSLNYCTKTHTTFLLY